MKIRAKRGVQAWKHTHELVPALSIEAGTVLDVLSVTARKRYTADGRERHGVEKYYVVMFNGEKVDVFPGHFEEVQTIP